MCLKKHKFPNQHAIKKALDYLNISKSEAIAFGDGGNDIDMLEYVGLGIAMENGEERLNKRRTSLQKKQVKVEYPTH